MSEYLVSIYCRQTYYNKLLCARWTCIFFWFLSDHRWTKIYFIQKLLQAVNTNLDNVYTRLETFSFSLPLSFSLSLSLSLHLISYFVPFLSIHSSKHFINSSRPNLPPLFVFLPSFLLQVSHMFLLLSCFFIFRVLAIKRDRISIFELFTPFPIPGFFRLSFPFIRRSHSVHPRLLYL